MYANDNQYNQNIAVTFTGQDDLTEVIDKINENVSNFQLNIFKVNAGLQIFNKVTSDGIPLLTQFSTQLHGIDDVFTKGWNVISIAKSISQVTSGIQEASTILSGFNEGIQLMAASGFNPKIIKDFEQLNGAISLDKESLESFTFNAVTAYNQFAKAKTEVAVLFDKDSDFIANLSTNIHTLVNGDLQNAVTSIQALGASYQAASAGFISAADNTAVMTSGLKLAKAGGAEAGTVMKVLTQTLRAYGLQAQDADKVSAVLNKTVQLGITTIPELSNGFAQAAVTAKQAGVSLTELGSATAALTVKGFDTSSALTDLQALFRIIINKTPEASDALANLRDETGKPIRFDIAEIKEGKTEGLTKAIERLNNAAKGNPEVIAQIVRESTAYSAFITLAANGAQQLKDNNSEMLKVAETGAKASKALNDVFGIKVNNQSEKFEQIVNRITEQFIQFGEQLAPFFEEGINAVEQFTKKLASLSPQTKKLIADFLIAQLTFYKVTDAIGALVGGVTKAFLTFQSWRLLNMVFTGELFKLKDIVVELAVEHKNLGAALLQIIGIDQKHILAQKASNEVQLNRFQIIKQLKEENQGLIPQIKQLIGINQEHLLTVKNANTEELRRVAGLKLIVENNKSYQKEVKKLTELENEYKHAQEANHKLGQEISGNHKEIISNKQGLKTAELELQKVSGTNVEAIAVENYVKQQEKLAVSEAVLATNKQKYLKEEKELQESFNKVVEQATKVDTVSISIKEKTLIIDAAQNKATELKIASDKAKAISSIAATQAEEANTLAKSANNLNTDLNTAAQLASERATILATEAKVAETVAENANTAAMKLKRNLYIEQQIAEGNLIKIRKFGIEQTIANNALNRVLYGNIGKAGTEVEGAIAKSGKGLGGLWSGFLSASGTVFSFIGTKLLPQIGNLLINIAKSTPETLALLGLITVAYDNWFGTAAKLRKIGEETNKIQQEGYKNTIKELEKRHNLTAEGQLYVDILKDQSKEAEGFKSTWENIGDWFKSFFESVGDTLHTFFLKLVESNPITKSFGDGFNLIGKGLNKIGKSIGEVWDNFRVDQTEAAFRSINKSILQSQDLIIKATAINQKYKEGLTGDKDVDKLIKAGKSLSINDVTKVNREFEERKIELQGTIRTLEEQRKTLDKQLEGKDLADPSKLSASDKLILQRKNLLEGVLEQDKQALSNATNNIKDWNDYERQREVLLQRIKENDQQLISGTTKEDIGTNPLETRLKKSLRQNITDLGEFAVKVENTVKSTNKDLKGGIADLGSDFVVKFDQKVATTIGSIDKLYENGYYSASEAQKAYQKVLNTTITDASGTQHKLIEILDTQQYLDIANRINKTAKESSEFRLSLLAKELDKTKALQDSGTLSFIEGNRKLRDNQTQQLQEQIKSVKENISVLLKDKIGNKSELTQLYAQLAVLDSQYQAKAKENLIADIEDRYKIQQENYDRETGLLKLSNEKNLLTTEEYNKKNSELLQKENLSQQEKIKQQIAVFKNTKKDTSELNKQLLELQTQYVVNSRNALLTSIEDKHRLTQEGYNKDSDIIKINYEKGLLDTENYNSQLDNLNKKQNLDSQAKLKEQLNIYKNTKKDTYEIQKQILDLQLQYEGIITAAYERELAKRNKAIENSTNSEKLNYQQVIDTIGFTISALEDENKVRESRNKLLLINDNNEQARLELSLKTTADIVNRALIEEKISESKYKTLLISQQIEKESLINQQKTLELTFQKQQLELNIKNIENQGNRETLELELERATKFKKQNKEEIEGIKLKLKVNSEEARVNNLQEKTMERQKLIQKELLSNSLIDLNNKQQIAREGGLLDTQLAKENVILAGYQKQADQAKVEAQITELNGNKIIKQQELITQLIQLRVDKLNKQQQLEQINQDNIQQQYKLAQDLALTEYQKQNYARAAAQAELNALTKKQQIEQQVLDMQIKSNQLAYQRQIIEQQVAEVRLSAEVKVQAAETKKVLANRLSTDEEKDASRAQLEAKQFELTAKQYERIFLKEKGDALQLDEQVSRTQLASNQKTAQQNALVNLAKTSSLKSEQLKIFNAVKDNLGDEPYQLRRQALDSFNPEQLKQIFSRQIIPKLTDNLSDIIIPDINSQLKVPLTDNINMLKNINNNDINKKNNNDANSKKNKDKLNITLNNTNNITVTGANGDTTEYAKKLRQVTIDTVFQIARTANVELNNI